MDDRRRYLKQLLEMGETDLVIEDVRRESGVVRRPADAAPEGLSDARRTTHDQSARSGPAMYPPGLTIESPAQSSDLFTADPTAAAPDLATVARLVDACRKCSLGHSRQHSVPGEGNPRAQLACVGEAPGQTEDETGRPFVGRAGKLLEDILKAIGLAREDVFICNVLKCRPPGNRAPEPMEVAACSPYLHRQLELIRPKVILALGRPAATTLLNQPTTVSLGDLRGKVHRYRGIPLVVTYHPAALLRNPNWKPATWDDVRIARRLLDGETA